MLTPIDIDPKTFLRQNYTLPALPDVVSQIQSIIYKDDVDIQKIADLVSADPSLVAQILKIVNSAYYGLPKEVTKVRVAIAFLGLNEIYRMTLSLSVINTLAIKEKDELNKFWFHSFYTALCTKYLAKKYEPLLSSEELWSAAILHDIGKLAYLKFFPDHYKALISFCKEHGSMFSDAEKHFSLPSSSFFGTLLCDHWRLPTKVRQSCECHTLKDLLSIQKNSPSAGFQRMICLGNLIAIFSAEELSELSRQELIDAVNASIGCSKEEFLVIMGDIYEQRAEVERFMGQFS
ncbi:MAG: HDOD domain-containing protein [Thermodesulfobacteriota bacterium]|nr:HDOD domain-containing protein [Thermodesulfobacteriota bacterium]